MNLYSDEPTFTLRAADKYAPAIIFEWTTRVIQSPNATHAQFIKAAKAHQVGIAMLEWQEANPDKVKVPDSVILQSKINDK